MNLQFDLQTPKKPFAAAGSILLTLTLRNTGDAPADVPEPEPPPPFEYIVYASDGRVIETASVRKKQLARSRGMTPRIATGMQPLAPGDVMIYRQDLADLLLKPLAPGRYELEAWYRLPGNVVLKSSRVPVEVVVQRPAAYIQGLDAKRASLITIDFQPENEGVALRKWESRTDTPAMGRFQTLYRSPGVPKTLSMALEAEPGGAQTWRWVTWLEGDALFGGMARAIDFKYPFGPFKPDLDGLSLLEWGYQYEDGRGLFIVTGMSEGRRRVQLLTLRADDEPITVQEVQLTNVPEAPWGASLTTSAEGTQEIVLSWILQGKASSAIIVCRANPATGAVTSPPRRIFETSRAMAAVHIPPLLSEMRLDDALSFLLAPRNTDERFTLVRFDIEETSKQEETELPPLEAAPVTRWVLPSHSAANAPVMAVAKGTLWVWRPGGSWKNAGVKMEEEPRVQLWSLPTEQYWLSWFNPVEGFIFHRIG